MPGVRRGRGPGGRSRISVLASVPFRSAAGRGAGARAREYVAAPRSPTDRSDRHVTETVGVGSVVRVYTVERNR